MSRVQVGKRRCRDYDLYVLQDKMNNLSTPAVQRANE
jgi:hypothetical protein